MEFFRPNERLHVVTTHRGAQVGIDVVQPGRAPERAAILFAGDTGRLGFTRRGIRANADNFLVRTREHYPREGDCLAVLMDAPSDHRRGLGGFRTSEAHAQDVGAVVDWIHSRFGALPVWLVGTSRGTLSAANAAARLPEESVAGVVLSSPVTRSIDGQECLSDVRVEHIVQPTLVVANRGDRCRASPPSGAAELMEELDDARTARLVLVPDHSRPGAGPDSPGSAHAFAGNRREVTDLTLSYMAHHDPG